MAEPGHSGLAVAVTDVTVRYGDLVALDAVSHTWATGVNAILGPNGAGKSTLFRVVTASLRPENGQLALSGAPVDDRRSRERFVSQLGYLPQDPGWFGGFTVREFVHYFARLRRLDRRTATLRTEQVIDQVQLADKAGTPLGELSGGQRRRAFLAQAIVHDPRVLVLDEPTAGLDPVQRLRLRALVTELGSDRLILLATHLVEDVNGAADVLVLDAGRAVWSGPPGALADLGQRRARTGDTASDLEAGFLAVVERSGEER